MVRIDERLELREGNGRGALEQDGCVVVCELNAGPEVLEGVGELRDRERSVFVSIGCCEESCPNLTWITLENSRIGNQL